MTALLVGLGVGVLVLLAPRSAAARRRSRLVCGLTVKPSVPEDRSQQLSQFPRRAQRTDLVAAYGQLAGLARAGLSPAEALGALVTTLPDDAVAAALRRAADRAGRGSAVPPALAAEPGLTGLAATWAVVTATGAPIAEALDRLALATADDLDARRAMDAAMAGPRATARVLVALPPLAVLAGQGLGTGSVQVLFGTPLGLACLGVGVAGMVGGWWWSRRLLAEALRVG